MAKERKKNKELVRYQHLLDNSPDFVFESRIDNFRFTAVNVRACKFYGYSEEEFLKMQIFDIEVDAPLKKEVRRLYKNTPVGKVIEVYGHNKRKDGSTFPVHVRFTKIDNKFALANVRDITGIELQTNSQVSSNQLVSNHELEFERIQIRLSAREREVLNLTGKGLDASAISKQLNLSIKTISTYRKRLLEKLGLKNSVELAQYSVKASRSEEIS